MAGAIVQSGDLGSSASASSISLAFGSNNAASNVLFVFGHANDQSDALTPSDSRGNTYAVLDNLVDSVDNHKTQHACVVTSSAGANTVTYGVSPNSDFLGIYIAELSGLQNVAADAHKAVQQSAPGTGSNAVTTGAVTTTATDFCMAVTKVNGGAGTMSVGTGFTQDTNAGGFSGWGAGIKMMVELKASVASGTPAATFTSSSGSANYLTHAAWFKESGGGGSFTVTASDSVTLSDSATKVTNFGKTASDSLSLSDSAVEASTLPRIASDTITLSDSATKGGSLGKTASDTISLSDSAVEASNLPLTAIDSLSLSDSGVAIYQPVGAKTASDSLSLSDSAICRFIKQKSASDIIVFTDSAVASGGNTGHTFIAANYVGLHIQQAGFLAYRAGFDEVLVNQQRIKGILVGQVVAQLPTAGSTVTIGSDITFTIVQGNVPAFTYDFSSPYT